MDDTIFQEISIRGRVAYGICCLERALLHYGCSLEKWRWILERLWQYTELEYLDDWYYEIAEFLPDTLLDNAVYNSQIYEYISEEQFLALDDTYKKESNNTICQIFRLVFEMGTMDLYSKLEGYAITSLNYLNEIIEVMRENNMDLPSNKEFLEYKYHIGNGWGRCFVGKKHSLFFKNA